MCTNTQITSHKNIEHKSTLNTQRRNKNEKEDSFQSHAHVSHVTFLLDSVLWGGWCCVIDAPCDLHGACLDARVPVLELSAGRCHVVGTRPRTGSGRSCGCGLRACMQLLLGALRLWRIESKMRTETANRTTCAYRGAAELCKRLRGAARAQCPATAQAQSQKGPGQHSRWHRDRTTPTIYIHTNTYKCKHA